MNKISKKAIIWGFLSWTLWVLIYAITLTVQVKEVSFLIGLLSSANTNYIYAFFSIFIWYICAKLPIEKEFRVSYIIAHIILSLLISVLWQFLTIFIWYLAEGDIALEYAKTFVYWQFLFGIIIYFGLISIFYVIRYNNHVREQEKQRAELQILMREAELKALRLQMNPHFLFNSLNSINALIFSEPQLARKMITQLSELLRMSFEIHEQLTIPLHTELEFLHKYIAIEQVRFGDKMKYMEHVDSSLLTKSFPAMILQPLIENAVKHGIGNSRHGGEIELRVVSRNSRIQCMVKNVSRDTFDTYQKDNNSSKTGIKNIVKRLELLYPDDHTFTIDQSKQNIFKIDFEIPLKMH